MTKLYTDTSANLPLALLREYDIAVIPFSYTVNGVAEDYNEETDFDGKAFYDAMRRGAEVKTSMVNPATAAAFFERALAQGDDVLYVGMSGGISGTAHAAALAAEELREKYPRAKIMTIDTYAASLGEGLQVLEAAELLRAGKSFEEVGDRILARRPHMCQFFTVDDLNYLKRGGRISSAAGASPARRRWSARCSASSPSCAATRRATSFPAARCAGIRRPTPSWRTISTSARWIRPRASASPTRTTARERIICSVFCAKGALPANASRSTTSRSPARTSAPARWRSSSTARKNNGIHSGKAYGAPYAFSFFCKSYLVRKEEGCAMTEPTKPNENEEQRSAPEQTPPMQPIVDMGAVTTRTARGTVYCLTVVGQIEGHSLLPNTVKTTKYEHVLPLLAALDESEEIDGVLLLLNTCGGDVEAGLAIAELIAGMRKPTVSLVLGGGHSIGVPLAVAPKRSLIAPSASMTVHPIRTNGTLIAAPQTYHYFDRLQERIVRFVTKNSGISEKKLLALMLAAEDMAADVGSILYGEEAVADGLIDRVGTLADAYEELYALIAEARAATKLRRKRAAQEK